MFNVNTFQRHVLVEKAARHYSYPDKRSFTLKDNLLGTWTNFTTFNDGSGLLRCDPNGKTAIFENLTAGFELSALGTIFGVATCVE